MYGTDVAVMHREIFLPGPQLLIKKPEIKADSARPKQPLVLGKVTYPFLSYGWEEMPKAGNILIKNATVWTSEKEGKLENTDVLVKDGKIAGLEKILPMPQQGLLMAQANMLLPALLMSTHILHHHLSTKAGKV